MKIKPLVDKGNNKCVIFTSKMVGYVKDLADFDDVETSKNTFSDIYSVKCFIDDEYVEKVQYLQEGENTYFVIVDLEDYLLYCKHREEREGLVGIINVNNGGRGQ